MSNKILCYDEEICGTSSQASDIVFDPTNVSGVSSTNVQGAISELNNGMNKMTAGTITRHSSTGTSGTFESTVCTKIGHLVNASAWMYGVSLTANGYFFKIPEGFRPKTTTVGYAYMYIGSNNIASKCTIYASGDVAVSYSSGQTLSQIGFVATYYSE